MEKFFSRLHDRQECLKQEHGNKKGLWKDDEAQVRQGRCDFLVKYLGHTEIYESKGADICRQSFSKLKAEEHGFSLTSVFHHGARRASTTSHCHATFHVSTEGISVLDENEDILIDVPIGEVSFCCPNSQYERGFTFICRSNVPWKWQCHAVEAIDDYGDRLTNAVGCAFSMHFEKQMQNRRENAERQAAAAAATGVAPAATIDVAAAKQSTKFRTQSLTDSQFDAQRDEISRNHSDGGLAMIERPRPRLNLKHKQGSLDVLMEVHPHRRQVQGRMGELLQTDEEIDTTRVNLGKF